jgi:glycerol-3-phosphate cytidylyltransferase
MLPDTRTEPIYGVTFGAFDLLHTGHLIFLKQCKQYCDKLIVGLHSDPSIERETKNRPVESIFERWTRLLSCKYVDIIIPYDTEQDIENILNIELIHKRFLGEDYKDSPNITGKDICVDKGIEIIYLPRKHTYSSTNLRERIRCL